MRVSSIRENQEEKRRYNVLFYNIMLYVYEIGGCKVRNAMGINDQHYELVYCNNNVRRYSHLYFESVTCCVSSLSICN